MLKLIDYNFTLKFYALKIFVSGRGGASIYGKEFDDELHSELKHTGE